MSGSLDYHGHVKEDIWIGSNNVDLERTIN